MKESEVIARLRVLDDTIRECAFEIGDLLNAVKQAAGKPVALRCAQAALISEGKALQRMWLSGKIPPGHWMRDLEQCPLSYAHLRALAGRADRDRYARQAVAQRWTVDQLKNALELGEDNRFLQGEAPCRFCKKEVDRTNTLVVALILGKQREKAWCCDRTCALGFLVKLQSKDPGAAKSSPLSMRKQVRSQQKIASR